MGDKGKKDKGKREQQKKALRNPKEKRKQKSQACPTFDPNPAQISTDHGCQPLR